ncbi:MFS transporter [Listeria kieliensis]
MLKNRNFRYLWSGRLISNAGDSIYYIVLSWYILQITKDSFWVGLINFAIFIPNIFSFVFGHWIDQGRKKHALIFLETGQFISVAVMALTIGFGVASPILLAVLAFLAAGFGMNTYTIQDALLPKIVARKELASAQKYMSFAYNGTEYFFNAIAGFLIQFFSTVTLLVFNLFSFIAAIFSFSKLENKETSEAVQEESEGLKANLFKGFSEIWHNRPILLIVCCGAIANFLFGGLNVYQVLIADKQGSAIILGLITSSMAIGTLIGATFGATLFARFFALGQTLTFATCLYGFCIAISGLSTNSLGIIFWLGIANIFLGVTHVVQKPFYQVLVPHKHLGKVFSAASSFSVTALPLGSLFFGLVSDYLSSAQFLYLFGGVYLAIGIFYWNNRSVFRFQL